MLFLSCWFLRSLHFCPQSEDVSASDLVTDGQRAGLTRGNKYQSKALSSNYTETFFLKLNIKHASPHTKCSIHLEQIYSSGINLHLAHVLLLHAEDTVASVHPVDSYSNCD